MLWVTNPENSHEAAAPLASAVTQLNAIQSGPLATHSDAHSSTVVLSWLSVGGAVSAVRFELHVAMVVKCHACARPLSERTIRCIRQFAILKSTHMSYAYILLHVYLNDALCPKETRSSQGVNGNRIQVDCKVHCQIAGDLTHLLMTWGPKTRSPGYDASKPAGTTRATAGTGARGAAVASTASTITIPKSRSMVLNAQDKIVEHCRVSQREK